MIIWLLGSILVAAASSYYSSSLNKTGEGLIAVIVIGIVTSLFWAYCSRVSTSLLRDSLIWDVLYVATFSLVLVFCGHAAKYELKHWLGIGLLSISFLYWSLIDWIKI